MSLNTQVLAGPTLPRPIQYLEEIRSCHPTTGTCKYAINSPEKRIYMWFKLQLRDRQEGRRNRGGTDDRQTHTDGVGMELGCRLNQRIRSVS